MPQELLDRQLGRAGKTEVTLLSRALAYRALCLLLTIHESRSNNFLSEGLAFACRCFIAGIDLVITTALSRNTYYNSYS